MAKILELEFINELGTKAKISIDNPIEPVDPVAVSAAMDTIITANTFQSSGGELVSKSRAQLVERNVSTVEIG